MVRHKRQTVEAGCISWQGQKLPVTVRIDRRAKRLIMRIDHTGRIKVTCPHEKDISAALAMAESRQEWIGCRLAELPMPTPFLPGAAFPVLGRLRHIIHDPNARPGARLEPDRIRVGGLAGDTISHRVERLLRREAQAACRQRVAPAAARIGVEVGRIRVRDMKTRWGSCTSTGDLTFNWRLIHAPLAVLDYVVAHEVAHRRYMDHSPAFWRLVQTLSPDYREHEIWLREEGRTLFSYGAEPAFDMAA